MNNVRAKANRTLRILICDKQNYKTSTRHVTNKYYLGESYIICKDVTKSKFEL